MRVKVEDAKKAADEAEAAALKAKADLETAKANAPDESGTIWDWEHIYMLDSPIAAQVYIWSKALVSRMVECFYKRVLMPFSRRQRREQGGPRDRRQGVGEDAEERAQHHRVLLPQGVGWKKGRTHRGGSPWCI